MKTKVMQVAGWGVLVACLALALCAPILGSRQAPEQQQVVVAPQQPDNPKPGHTG
jgi:Na+/proline symporter